MTFIENNTDGVVYLTSPNIQVTHAFTTRFGGVSQGIYSSLNLGINRGDSLDLVRENYDLICRVLNITVQEIVCSFQIHSAHIRVVTRDDCGQLFKSTPHMADGLITREAGVALMVFSADCVPILLHDPVHNAIGAIHAGWRGTTQDIAGAAIRKMTEEYGCSPQDIRAAIGPCISKCCYETGEDVAAALRKALGKPADDCITINGGKYKIDLKKANHLLLSKAGLNDITISSDCTSCKSEKYWSHRKTNGERGSQVALILNN